MDKLVYGLDFPNDIANKNMEIIMKELGITKDEIKNYKDDEE